VRRKQFDVLARSDAYLHRMKLAGHRKDLCQFFEPDEREA
jgi:hypothetical protein